MFQRRKKTGAGFLLALLAVLTAVTFTHAPSANQTTDPLKMPDPPQGWPRSVSCIEDDDDLTPLKKDDKNLGRMMLASIVEPFAIGEALYNPGGVADAVVSLLDLMGVRVGEGGGNAALPVRATGAGGARFTLSDADLQVLIASGEEDAVKAAESEEGPFTFRDLYRIVSPALPGVSIERLASVYSEAYDNRPDDLAAQAMLGQPITPETPLLRTQIWLLLADGFSPPDGPAGRHAWGTAAARMPPLQSPEPGRTPTEWGASLPARILSGAFPLFKVSPRPAATVGRKTPVRGAPSYRITIVNTFSAKLPLGVVGNGQRAGTDQACGTLYRQSDGTFRGTFTAQADAWQRIDSQVFGKNCPLKHSKWKQSLRVEGTMVPSKNRTSHFSVQMGALDVGYLSLRFFPQTEGEYEVDDPCQQKILSPTGRYFIPLNDTRWTLPPPELVIGLPKPGTVILVYQDDLDVDEVFGASVWYVQVEALT